MRIYAERPLVRTRQVAIDLTVLAWCVGAVWVGRRVRDLVGELAGPGEALEDAGGRFAGGFDRVAEAVPELPIVGDALRTPFVAVADAGRGLEAAGRTQQETVASLAFWLALAIALALLVAVLVRYVPGRLGWIREATAAARLRDEGADLRLFAHRAAATRPLVQLRSTVADPGAALAAGDYEALAELELRALGLRTERPRAAG